MPRGPYDLRPGTFGKFIFFAGGVAALLGTGLYLLVHDVLQMEDGPLSFVAVFALTMLLMVPVYWLGIRIWSSPGKRDPPT